MITVYAIIQISLREICHFFPFVSITLLNIHLYHSVPLNEVNAHLFTIHGDARGISHPFWTQLWREHSHVDLIFGFAEFSLNQSSYPSCLRIVLELSSSCP